MTQRETSAVTSAGRNSAEAVTLPPGEFNGSWPRILDAVSDGVMLLDPDQRILYCNTACLQLTNRSADKLIGRQCWEAFHGTDGPLAECPFKRLVASAKRESMELETNGRWYQVTVDPLRLAGTDRLGAVHIVRDITEQKRIAEALSQSIEKMRVICKFTPDPIFLKDAESRLVMINPATAKAVGKPIEEIIGKSDVDLYADPAIGRAIVETDRRIMKEGRPQTVEEIIQTPTGNRVFLSTKSPWVDSSGKVIGIIGVSRDITRRKAEQRQLEALNHTLERRVQERTAELQASREKYRDLLENTLDIPFRVDADGRVTYIGPQVQRYGFDPADMTGRHFVDYIFAEDQSEIAKAFERTLRTGRAIPTQFRIQVPGDEAVRWMEERSTLQRDANGETLGLTGVLRDITERKHEEKIRLNQQRRLHDLAAKLASAQDEEQRRIANGLHDDVAQLLTAALMKMAVARRTKNPEEAAMVRRELEELLRAANEKVRLLSFELASSTLYRLGIEDALAELCEGMSERYGIDFALRADAQTKPLAASAATVLFKAARELLFNVVKHAKTGKAVVDLRRKDGAILLSVRDHGIGFAMHDEGNREPRAGKGLGLFEIRERLLDLGGNVAIESEPEAGTRVTLSVPLGGIQKTGADEYCSD